MRYIKRGESSAMEVCAQQSRRGSAIEEWLINKVSSAIMERLSNKVSSAIEAWLSNKVSSAIKLAQQ